MENYTFAEYADMLLIYGEARCNGRAASRLYAERFPERRIPAHTLFARINQRLRETGSVEIKRLDNGAQRTIRTPEFEEEVLRRFENNPAESTRAVADAMRVNHVSVWEVLHEQLLHPYRLQKVQELGLNDFIPRVEFCQWFLDRCREEPQFPKYVLFTDEAVFTKEGIFNSHNSHVWAEENPHGVHIRGYQHRFSVNMWAGIVGERLIGPIMLPPRLTGTNYLDFLRNVLPELFHDLPLNVRQNLWFQHDGAPAHFSLLVREHLNENFRGCWIGRGGPVAWPARSPDLTPLDYFLWGHMKSLVYETPVESEEDLVARISAAAEIIQAMPDVFSHVNLNMLRRCNKCIERGGRHFQQLLF